MIEFSARLTRGAVYFAGEELECLISFRNNLLPISNALSDSPDKVLGAPNDGNSNGKCVLAGQNFFFLRKRVLKLLYS
jgi:hypothetical protein